MPLTLTNLGLPSRLQALLHGTSRSFYRTIQVLPGSVRPQIALAYLLARATDTIADTQLVPVEERLAGLEALRDRVLGTRTEPVNLARLAMSQQGGSSLAERQLLERIEEVVAQMANLGHEDTLSVREVLSTITSGQELDLRRFELAIAESSPAETAGTPAATEETPAEREVALAEGQVPEARPEVASLPPVILPPAIMPTVVVPPVLPPPQPRPLRALETEAELNDYTYRVAGCVGEFWTKLTRRHCFPRTSLDEAAFLADGIRFGQGLQLVNILRDLPRDLRNGRCYLPRVSLASAGLTPEDLLDPANEPRLRPLYRDWVERACQHLQAGWRYTNTIPHGHFRLRLACAWPILIGVRTLVKLLVANPLDPLQRIKVSRSEVKEILVGSTLRLPLRAAWKAQFERMMG